MSHNVYCEDLKSKLTNMCKYLVLVENELHQEVIPCTCLTDAIKFAENENSICRIYERLGSMSKTWTYLCDVSKGVI